MQAPRAPISCGRGSGTAEPTARVPDGSSEVLFALHRYERAMPQAAGAVLASFASPSYVAHVPAVPLQPNEVGSLPQDLARRVEPYPQGIGQSLAPVSSAPAYGSHSGNRLRSGFGGEHDCGAINGLLISITQLRMNHVNQIPAAHGTMGAHGAGLRGALPPSYGHSVSVRPAATSFGPPSVPFGVYPTPLFLGALPQYVPKRGAHVYAANQRAPACLMVPAREQWHAPDYVPHASRLGDGRLHAIFGTREQHIGDRNGQGGVHGAVHGRAGRDDWTRRRAGSSCTARLNANDVSSHEDVPVPAVNTMPEPLSAHRPKQGTADGLGRSGHRPRAHPPLDWVSSAAVLEAATLPATA